MEGNWHYVFECDKCKYINHTWEMSLCPKCGDKKSLYYHPECVAYGWTPKVARLISDVVWYKPSTWNNKHYEFK